jgi:hypothetical protein
MSAPDAPPAAPSGRPAGYVPGQKKARHKRMTRVATAIMVVGALAFGVGVWIVVRSFLLRPSEAENAISGTRKMLSELAEDARGFAAIKNRLPERLGELRAPDLPSRFDAEPWDRWKHPIEYRVLDEKTSSFELRSFGPDGRPDTADDLVWPEGQPWR